MRGRPPPSPHAEFPLLRHLRAQLWDPYGDCHMGGYAELCAETYDITREDQDAHADESYRRARNAIGESRFAEEVVPVEAPGKKRGTTIQVSI